MPYSVDDKIVIAVSSRALFDFQTENLVFELEGVEAYRKYQQEHLGDVAGPGVAFPLVSKLLRFNSAKRRRVEVIVLSRNDPGSGLRVFRSAEALGIDVSRGIFTRGKPPFAYLRPFNAVLFLSAEPEDVRGALENGFPAATVYSHPGANVDPDPNELRIAMDGDGVLFDDSSESIFQQQGLEEFQRNEQANADSPMNPGPFLPFMKALRSLQDAAEADRQISIRTMLITARNAPSHERAIRTLMEMKIEVDEAAFLGGLGKMDFLQQFQPDFYFDDQRSYTDAAAKVTASGHVPYGAANAQSAKKAK